MVALSFIAFIIICLLVDAIILAIKKKKAVQLDAAIERNIMICSLSSMEDLLTNKSLKERNFWTEIEHSELGMKIPYPRQFANMSGASVAIKGRAPMVGEHNTEVYRELGLDDGEIAALKQSEVI